MNLNELLISIQQALGQDRNEFMANSVAGLARRKFVILGVIFTIETLKQSLSESHTRLPQYLLQVRNCIAHNTDLRTIDYHNATLWEFWHDCVAQVSLLLDGRTLKYDTQPAVSWVKPKIEKQRLTDLQTLLTEIESLVRYQKQCADSEKQWAKAAVVFNIAMLGQVQFADHLDDNNQHYRTVCLQNLLGYVSAEGKHILQSLQTSRDKIFHPQGDFSAFLASHYHSFTVLLPLAKNNRLLQEVLAYQQHAYGRALAKSSQPLHLIEALQTNVQKAGKQPLAKKDPAAPPQDKSLPVSSSTSTQATAQTPAPATTHRFSTADIKTSLQETKELIEHFLSEIGDFQHLMASIKTNMLLMNGWKKLLIDTIKNLRQLHSTVQQTLKNKLSNTNAQEFIDFTEAELQAMTFPTRLEQQVFLSLYAKHCVLDSEETTEFVVKYGEALPTSTMEPPCFQPLILAIIYQAPLATIRLLLQKGHTLDYIFSDDIAKSQQCRSPLSLIFRNHSDYNVILGIESNSYLILVITELFKVKPLHLLSAKSDILACAIRSMSPPAIIHKLIELGCNLNDKITIRPLETDPEFTIPLWALLIQCITFNEYSSKIYGDLIFELADSIDVTTETRQEFQYNGPLSILFTFAIPVHILTTDDERVLESVQTGVPASFVKKFLEVFRDKIPNINLRDSFGNTPLAMCCQPSKPMQTTDSDKSNYQHCVDKLRLLINRSDINLEVNSVENEFIPNLTRNNAIALSNCFKGFQPRGEVRFNLNTKTVSMTSHIFIRCCTQGNTDMMEILLDAVKNRALSEFDRYIDMGFSVKTAGFVGLYQEVLELLTKAKAMSREWHQQLDSATALTKQIEQLSAVANRPSMDMATRLKFATRIQELQAALQATQKNIADLQARSISEWSPSSNVAASNAATVAPESIAPSGSTNSNSR